MMWLISRSFVVLIVFLVLGLVIRSVRTRPLDPAAIDGATAAETRRTLEELGAITEVQCDPAYSRITMARWFWDADPAGIRRLTLPQLVRACDSPAALLIRDEQGRTLEYYLRTAR